MATDNILIDLIVLFLEVEIIVIGNKYNTNIPPGQ